MGKKIEQENLSELNTQLVQEETPETSTEKKLLFTDYSIGRFQGNFLDKDNNALEFKAFKNDSMIFEKY